MGGVMQLSIRGTRGEGGVVWCIIGGEGVMQFSIGEARTGGVWLIIGEGGGRRVMQLRTGGGGGMLWYNIGGKMGGGGGGEEYCASYHLLI